MVRGNTEWLAVVLLCAFLPPGPVDAEVPVNLEWRPPSQTVQVGDTVNIGLYAVCSDPNTTQSMAAMDVIFAWDPERLRLLGLDCTGAANWLYSGFPDDPYGLNETIPPQDGDGLYTALSPLGNPVHATPEGTLVTTFQFEALSVCDLTIVDILESAGSPPAHTVVYSGDTPNTDVTGTLGHAEVTIVCQLCPGDLNGDGVIDLIDLATLLAHYDTPSGADPWEGDLDCDGDVDLSDLAALLAVYNTECP